ncbi:MAG: HpcH/HpaI aldolase family protein [Solirubrobacteraceae bacterium]
MSGAVPSRFRSRLQGNEVLAGSFVNLGSGLVTEIMGIAGFDWLVLDLEHGAGDEHALAAQLQALGRTETAAIVRVEAIDPARVQHALDVGADGVMVPRIRTSAEAQMCVEFCRYSGRRGVARYNRSWHWGLSPRTLADADAEVVCVIQIETAEALERVDEIAAVDGVDVLFVGPSDLSHALGWQCPPDDPGLLERVAGVARAAQAHGKAAGVLVGNVTQARAYADLGFTFIGCGSDGAFLAVGASSAADALRTLGPGAAGAAAIVDEASPAEAPAS